MTRVLNAGWPRRRSITSGSAAVSRTSSTTHLAAGAMLDPTAFFWRLDVPPGAISIRTTLAVLTRQHT